MRIRADVNRFLSSVKALSDSRFQQKQTLGEVRAVRGAAIEL